MFWLPEATKICWPFIVLVIEENPRQHIVLLWLALPSPVLIFIKMQVFTEAKGRLCVCEPKYRNVMAELETKESLSDSCDLWSPDCFNFYS